MNKKRLTYYNNIFPFLLFVATIFMGIGYAATTSVSLDLIGSATVKKQDGIYITDVHYQNDNNAILEDSKINYAYQTTLNSQIALSPTNANSSITYEIVIYNSTDEDYKFVETVYMLDENTYDNENIIFRLENLTKNDILKSKQSISFKLVFYYKNNTIPYNNKLNSLINFKFEAIEEIVSAGTLINVGNISTGIFGSSLSKANVEQIHLVDHKNIPTGAKSTWDASMEQNNSIIGWAIDQNQNGMYEIYLGADTGKITLPADSSYMFAGYSVSTINFSNVDTSQTTNMSYMFSNAIGLSSLDVSNFDTSNVTNMSSMFYYATSLIELNLSNFNTENVTTMSNMFYFSYQLTTLDLSSFNTSKVNNMNYMFYYLYKLQTLKFNNATFTHSPANATYPFYYVPSSVYIITKDNESRDWIQAKLGAGKGTIVTVDELNNQ